MNASDFFAIASLRQRDKLPQHNTIDNAVELIQKSQRILILTGAGISTFNRFCFSLLFIFLPPFLIGVSCGIPDFRSRDGLYASLKNQGEYDLDDPQQMYETFRSKPNKPVLIADDRRFDIRYFKENPSGGLIFNLD